MTSLHLFLQTPLTGVWLPPPRETTGKLCVITMCNNCTVSSCGMAQEWHALSLLNLFIGLWICHCQPEPLLTLGPRSDLPAPSLVRLAGLTVIILRCYIRNTDSQKWSYEHLLCPSVLPHDPPSSSTCLITAYICASAVSYSGELRAASGFGICRVRKMFLRKNC